MYVHDSECTFVGMRFFCFSNTDARPTVQTAQTTSSYIHLHDTKEYWEILFSTSISVTCVGCDPHRRFVELLCNAVSSGNPSAAEGTS